MHGDFILNPLSARRDVSRVLMQQGRVLLDSDWNEQVDVIVGSTRQLAADLLGNYTGMSPGAFKVAEHGGNLTVADGVYYVDGIRCWNPPPVVATGGIATPDPHVRLARPPQPVRLPANGNAGERLIAYLDVWEEHVSSAEDDSLREVALGGPDTTSRAKVVWRLRTRKIPTEVAFDLTNRPQAAQTVYEWLSNTGATNVALAAKAKENSDTGACGIAPEARYRGADNRLYRVEVHSPTPAGAKIKWSADNGSIVYPVRDINEATVFLETLGRDDRTRIAKGNWVEVVDSTSPGDDPPLDLVQVQTVDRGRVSVTLSASPNLSIAREAIKGSSIILRRWESNLIEVPSDLGAKWIPLRDGIEVRLSVTGAPARFRPGDYWLIPARAAIGDILWPKESPTSDTSASVPPHGVAHHYAPLAVITIGVPLVDDLRMIYKRDLEEGT